MINKFIDLKITSKKNTIKMRSDKLKLLNHLIGVLSIHYQIKIISKDNALFLTINRAVPVNIAAVITILDKMSICSRSIMKLNPLALSYLGIFFMRNLSPGCCIMPVKLNLLFSISKFSSLTTIEHFHLATFVINTFSYPFWRTKTGSFSEVINLPNNKSHFVKHKLSRY